MKRTRSIQGRDRAEVESLDGTPLILRYSLHPLKLLLLSFYRIKFLKVEIAVILYMIGRHLYNPLYQQYYYHIYGADILKNTSFVAPNGSFCLSSTLIDNYTGNNDSYKLDEAFSNHLVAYGQLANAIPSMIATIILGPVTDKYGRKIGIILPAIGTMLQGIFIFFIIKYTLDPYYFILANFISGSFGDFTSILSSSFAYVADVSSTRWRTLRIGLVQSALSIGSASGGIIVGYWLHAINCDSLPPLWAYIGCSLFIVVYTTLCVPESLSRSERTKLHGKSRRGVRSFVEGLRLYCGGLSLATTWRLYVTTAVMCVAVLNIYGGTLIEVYFLKALPFNFNSLQIGIYQSVREATQGLFSLFFMTVLVICSIADAWIILLATLVHCGCLVLLGFSNKTWQLYTIAAVKGMEGMFFGGSRGLISKLLEPEKQGVLFSMVASVEAVARIVASVAWPLVFPFTLQHNMRSGTTFFFMAGVGALLLPLVLSLFLIRDKPRVTLFQAPTKHHQGDRIGSEDDTFTGSSSTSSEDEYQPLLTKSWTSNNSYYGVNT